MDISRLNIKFIDGYERRITKDGMTQKDKILPYMTIVYPYRGYYEVGLENEPLSRLDAGQGCFMTAPGVRHTIVHKLYPGEEMMMPRWLRLSVMYDDVLDVTGWFTPPLLVTGEAAQPFIQAVDSLVALPEEKSPQVILKKLRIASSVLEGLLAVSRFHPAELELERIYPAVVRIKDHYDQRLTVDQLSQECAMSPASFYRLFRQTMKMTPMQYLDSYRLKQAAQQLLENEKLSVIAERCGFCDEFHLSRNFKNYYGVSPREYKKRTIL